MSNGVNDGVKVVTPPRVAGFAGDLVTLTKPLEPVEFPEPPNLTLTP